VVLINSNLLDVVTAIHLSKTIYSRIRWNFVWAFGYNVLAIPVAAGAFYPLMDAVLPTYVAGLAMVLSSLTVLSSSLLLNRYRPPKYEKEYKRSGDRVELSKVRMMASGKKLTIQCGCLQSGKPCQCPPDACYCDGCELHQKAASDRSTEGSLDEEDAYPGCPSSWGKSCNCKENCRCGPGCKCSHGEKAKLLE
jgi:hypothetical protein